MKKFSVVWSTKIYYHVIVEAEDEFEAASTVELGLTTIVSNSRRMLSHNKLQSTPEVHSVKEVKE